MGLCHQKTHGEVTPPNRRPGGLRVVPTGMAHTHPHHTHHTVTPVRGELPSADLPWLLGFWLALPCRRACASAHARTHGASTAYGSGRSRVRAIRSVETGGPLAGRRSPPTANHAIRGKTAHCTVHTDTRCSRESKVFWTSAHQQSGPNCWQVVRRAPVQFLVFHAKFGQNLPVRYSG
jgi:hypothetical protein